MIADSVDDGDEPLAPLTTERLLQRARSGDDAAMGRLLQRHRARLGRALRLRLPTELRASLDSDDACQNAFVSALGSIDRFEYRGEGSFLSWLVRIAERRLVDALRSGAGTEATHESNAALVEIEDSKITSPTRAVVRREQLDRLAIAMDSLPREDRELVIDREILGVSLGELAERTGRGREAVRRKIYRARCRLAEWFERNG